MSSEPMAELELSYDYSSDDKSWALYHSYLGTEDDWLCPPNEFSHPTTKRGKLKQRSREFLETFTVHGPARINWAVHWCRVIVWIIIFLIALIVCIVHCFFIVREYANYPKATVLERRYERKVPFPAVTFCSLNPLTQKNKVSSHATYGAFVELQQQNQDPVCSGLQEPTDDPLANEACSTYNCTNKYRGDYNWPILLDVTTGETGGGSGSSGSGGSGTGGSGTGGSGTTGSGTGGSETTGSGTDSSTTTDPTTLSANESTTTTVDGESSTTTDSTTNNETSNSTSSGETTASSSTDGTNESSSSDGTTESSTSEGTSDSSTTESSATSSETATTEDTSSSTGTDSSSATSTSAGSSSDSTTSDTSGSSDSTSSGSTASSDTTTTDAGKSSTSTTSDSSTTEETQAPTTAIDSSTTTTTGPSESEKSTTSDSSTSESTTTTDKNGKPANVPKDTNESSTKSSDTTTTDKETTTTTTESSTTSKDSTSDSGTTTVSVEIAGRRKRDVFQSLFLESEEEDQDGTWEQDVNPTLQWETLRRKKRATAVDTSDVEALVKESRTSDLSDLLGAIAPDRKVLKSSARPGHEVIKTCSFDRRHCNYKEFHRWVSDEFGMCYTFNSPHLETEDSANYTSADRRQHFIQKSSANTGHKSGLRLTLSVHASEYVSLLSPEVGFRVLVHAPWEAPFPSSAGFNVAPGLTYSIAVKKREVLRLDWPHDNCRGSDYEAFDYTQNLCLQMCEEEAYRRRCGCAVSDNPAFQLLEPCFRNMNVCDPFVNETAHCISDAYLDFESNKLPCDCPYNCLETQYTTTVSEARSNREMFTVLQNIKNINAGDDLCDPSCSCKDSTVRLHVYAPDHNYERQVDVPLYSCFSLVANLGGSLALFIGFSIISFFELLEYLLDLLLILVAPKLYDGKRGNKVDPMHEPRKVYILAGPPTDLPHGRRKLRPLRSEKRWKERFNQVFMSE